ncbi:MAG TPA: HD-GYP domain-containing protein, partial [Rhodocyclaceae bacterium]|nr:HD-GYP domain-containing protein [Rhodocyclaceae bacterium]
MFGNKSDRHMIRMDQLCIGLHVRLDRWLGHPFLFSSFKIKDEAQIAALRAMGLEEIEYLPQRSDTRPAEPAARTIPPPAATAPNAAFDALMQQKRERIETLSKERARIQAAEKKYVKTANSVKNVGRIANSNPSQAAAQAGEIADDLVEAFLAEEAPFIHLMGDHVADESAYYHSLNVTVLALIMARAVGIGDAQTVHDIVRGAVLHDVGKALIPSQVLLKTEDLNSAELKLLNLHPGYGIKLMQGVEGLPRRVLEIILYHHEMVDGSGYPKGLAGDAIDPAVRIVAIANAYDNLCNPRQVERSRTPSEALSHLFKNESAKFDRATLAAFIKALGIYPPGTIVKLKSGRIGIVMSVDSADLLHPDLMIYDQTIPKEDAAVLNLRRDLDDEV